MVNAFEVDLGVVLGRRRSLQVVRHGTPMLQLCDDGGCVEIDDYTDPSLLVELIVKLAENLEGVGK